MRTEITKMVVVDDCQQEILAEVEYFDEHVVKLELHQKVHDKDSWRELYQQIMNCIDLIEQHNESSTT